MPVAYSKFYAGRFKLLVRSAARNAIFLNLNNFAKFFSKLKQNGEPCCMVLCRTMQGRKSCASRQEKRKRIAQTKKQAPRQSSIGVISVHEQADKKKSTRTELDGGVLQFT
jgi:hypothetical protein